MKNIILIILLAATGCTLKEMERSNASVKSSILELDFSPSSINPCVIRVDTSTNEKLITLSIIRKGGSEDEIESSLSRRLTPDDYDAIIYSVLKLDSTHYQQQNKPTNSGVAVKTSYHVADSAKTLNFNSPKRDTDELLYNDLLDPIFLTLSKYYTGEKEVAYLEQLEQYFQYGFPLKIISNRPKVFRLYGNLSYNQETEESLNNFIDFLPSKEPVIIDMSNFSAMTTLYYPNFKKLLKRNSNIKWVSTHPEQLLEIGVKKEDIYTSKEAALKSISHIKISKASAKESCS